METGVRRHCRANGGDVKGQRGRVVGFFHDGGLCVKARAGQEDEKAREKPIGRREMRNMGVGLLAERIRASRRPSSRIPTETICKVPLQAAVDWTNSSSEVVRFPFSQR